jgi:hypothetical protein
MLGAQEWKEKHNGNGFEVTKKLQKSFGSLKKLFTFALANQEQDDRLRFLRKRKEQSSLT